jgi:hypothetical protein
MPLIEHGVCQTPYAGRQRALRGSRPAFSTDLRIASPRRQHCPWWNGRTAPRGNGLGPRCRANAEARQRSSRSSSKPERYGSSMSKNRRMSVLSSALGSSIAIAAALHLNRVVPVAASTSIRRRNLFSTIGHALCKQVHLLQHLKTLERRLSEASADRVRSASPPIPTYRSFSRSSAGVDRVRIERSRLIADQAFVSRQAEVPNVQLVHGR